MVISLESLVHILPRNAKGHRCEECGQERYGVTKKFKDFLDDYCFEIPKKKRKRIYSLRSSLVHEGKLLAMDQRAKFFIENQEDFDLEHESTLDLLEFRDLSAIAKTCFRTFLFRQFGTGE